jgi:hypothetical protein
MPASQSMSGSNYQRLRGSCHCGNIHVAIDWPDPRPTIPVCGCGFCTKHRAAWTPHPDGRFHLQIADASRVTPYRLGTGTADFHVCSTCGIVPIVTCVIEGTRYAVVNAAILDNVESSRFVQRATNFEGETTEERLARRRRNWMPEAAGSDD